MQIWVVRSIVAGLLLCAASSATLAADTSGRYGSYCVALAQSNLPSQSPEVIRQTVWSNLDDAKAAMLEPAVLASLRPSYIWAMEARWACEAAVGYLANGRVDTESIQKCDCFYQRHLSFR